MAYFLPCPHCDKTMPRAAKVCPHCRLTLEQALERSDKAPEEKPPIELYFKSAAVSMTPEQKLPVGLFIFLGLAALIKPALLSAGIFFLMGLFLTPAAQEALKTKCALALNFWMRLGLSILAIILGGLFFN